MLLIFYIDCYSNSNSFQAEVVTYKRVLRNAQKKQNGNGKGNQDPAIESVSKVLADLITVSSHLNNYMNLF